MWAVAGVEAEMAANLSANLGQGGLAEALESIYNCDPDLRMIIRFEEIFENPYCGAFVPDPEDRSRIGTAGDPATELAVAILWCQITEKNRQSTEFTTEGILTRAKFA
jgi:hypothetical protein